MPEPSVSCPHPTVLLRHEMPDGSAHVDWLLGQDPRGERPLVTFRLPRGADTLTAGSAETIAAERMADHRPVYLEYEGPVAEAPGSADRDRDRGRVRRLRTGRIVAWRREPGCWHVTIEWRGVPPAGAPGPQRLLLEEGRSRQWTLRPL